MDKFDHFTAIMAMIFILISVSIVYFSYKGDQKRKQACNHILSVLNQPSKETIAAYTLICN